MKFPKNIINKSKYLKAKKQADNTYKTHSIYKSMYIQKIYKELGGKYRRLGTTGSTSKWLKEEWIQVIPYLTKGENVVCGSNIKKSKVCRPFKRIDDSTPITIKELLKLHSKRDLLVLARKKNNDMAGRVYWKNLKFIESKKIKNTKTQNKKTI